MTSIKEGLLPLLLKLNPKGLQEPTDEAYEPFLKPLLLAYWKAGREPSQALINTVTGWKCDEQSRAYRGLEWLLRGAIQDVHRMKPEVYPDFQAITEISLIIHEFAGSGDIFDGGYVVVRQADGRHQIEHIYGPEGIDGEVDPRPWYAYHVHQRDIPEDVYKEFDWVEETDAYALLRGRDPDPCVRAEEIAQIGDEHGWANIDEYPLRLTGVELKERWLTPQDSDHHDWPRVIATETEENLFSSATQSAAEGPSAAALVIYDILTWCDVNEVSFESVVSEAAELRRRTKNADAEGEQKNADWAAHLIRNQLNTAKPSALMPINARIIVCVGDDERVELKLDEDEEWKRSDKK